MTRRAATDQPRSGCRHCGHDRNGHYERWTAYTGYHTYKHPTTRQILTRVLARRAARTNTTTTPERTP